jgi:hypothetical protein
MQSQLKMGQVMTPQSGLNVDMTTMATMEAQRLGMLDPQAQTVALQNLRLQSPQYADMVLQMLRQGQQPGQAAPVVDMRPMPEQRPPRRASGM